MKITDLIAGLPCTSAWDGWEDREVTGGYTSDLLSDVMAHAEDTQVLITIQSHKNTVAVAVLKDLAAILVASDRPIPEDMVEAAQDEGLPILVSAEDQYTCSWKLHKMLTGN